MYVVLYIAYKQLKSWNSTLCKPKTCLQLVHLLLLDILFFFKDLKLMCMLTSISMLSEISHDVYTCVTSQRILHDILK